MAPVDTDRHIRSLELDKILQGLSDLAVCDATKELALALRPAASYREAVRDMAVTVCANTLSNRFGTPSILTLTPCAEVVGKARVGATLSLRELLDMAYILRCVRGLITWKRQATPENEETPLDALFSQLDSNKPLEDEIGESILSEEEISDRASPELYDIRRKIRQAQLKARAHLDSLTRSSATQKFLQEQLVTMRNGRFVVPVKAEFRGEIKGIVHDTSASGATLFVEPISVVEQNNAVRELEAAEQNEIHRILTELSHRVGASADMLLNDYDIILHLDLIFAKSRLADKMRAVAPELVEEGGSVLNKARHPLIDPAKIVPITLTLGVNFDTLVITGPNTGGKTVALKTLGLLTLMAMCGLMIPCGDESRIRFYQKVLVDIGDEQSIEQSLSTFSGHMTNIISILGQADENALVLIDELGAGTDPVEGAALAVAIIDDLRRKKATLAATTHYAEIKMYAIQTPGVENGSCEFDVSTLRPTYRLLIGVPGRSNAFAISEKLGLPGDIITAAKEQVSRENTMFEDVVSGLEQTRFALEKERSVAEHYRREAARLKQEAKTQRQKLEKEQEQELTRAREQARSMVEQVKYQSNQLLNELEDLKKQKDKESFSSSVTDVKGTLRAYIRDLEDTANPVNAPKNHPAYRLPRKLKRGDSVMIVDLGAKGVVLSDQDDNDTIQVQAGILKTKVAVSSLRLLEQSKITLDGKGTVTARSVVAAAKEAIKTEIDLRGMDTGEAIMELDRYIDTAILSNVKTITAIHGKGTGALRTAVQNRLRKHKSIRTFRRGVYGEGEDGVTVIELK